MSEHEQCCYYGCTARATYLQSLMLVWGQVEISLLMRQVCHLECKGVVVNHLALDYSRTLCEKHPVSCAATDCTQTVPSTD